MIHSGRKKFLFIENLLGMYNITLLNFVKLSTLLIKKGCHKRYPTLTTLAVVWTLRYFKIFIWSELCWWALKEWNGCYIIYIHIHILYIYIRMYFWIKLVEMDEKCNESSVQWFVCSFFSAFDSSCYLCRWYVYIIK